MATRGGGSQRPSPSCTRPGGGAGSCWADERHGRGGRLRMPKHRCALRPAGGEALALGLLSSGRGAELDGGEGRRARARRVGRGRGSAEGVGGWERG